MVFITISEMKEYLRLPVSTAIEESVVAILFVSHDPTTGFTIVGETVDASDTQVLTSLVVGELETGASVSVKIQDSDSATTGFVDWFLYPGIDTSLTPVDLKDYTGRKRYVRLVARVTGAAAVFGAAMTTMEALTDEDAQLLELIQTATAQLEKETNRKYLSESRELVLDHFPRACYSDSPATLTELRRQKNQTLAIPFGNLVSVESIVYTDFEGTETTIDPTQYIVETNGEHHGRVLPAYGCAWPSFTPYPSKPIVITFTSGYGTSDQVPPLAKTAVKRLVADMYANRGEMITDARSTPFEDKTVERITDLLRLQELT